MITIALANRNRDLRIVKNCLQSLQQQSCNDFECIVVDYGSDKEYKSQLEQLLGQYPEIRYINCPVQGQLWHKCRAINVALQQAKTAYFLVGDIDLLFHPEFIAKVKQLRVYENGFYFQVGFLSKKESLLDKSFKDYQIDFKSNKEATGISLFSTEILKSLNGYDEFYHGWGAEDTDVHIRMRNAGYSVFFYDKEILLKHQWHSKVYRTKESTQPFHTLLERINNAYMVQTAQTKRTLVNQNQDWGKMAFSTHYDRLAKVDSRLNLKTAMVEVNAVLAQMDNFKDEVIVIEIQEVSGIEKIKNQIKKLLGKKYQIYYDMDVVNDLILETIIRQYRNNPYSYSYNRIKKQIDLKMYFL